MGMYLNPDCSAFLKNKRNIEFVDKSLLIREMNNLINTENNHVCVSRPRRFGKTIAANMLAAYYTKGCDSHDAFRGMKIESDPSFEEHINRYNVIAIDCGGIYGMSISSMNTVERINAMILPEFRKQFPDLFFPDYCDLATAINTV